MPLKNDPVLVIRKYGSRDRPAVRRICCETALMGEPSALFFDDDEIFADALTAYFTDYEPESCFVAEYGQAVVGYLAGAKDAGGADKIFACKLAAPLLLKALQRGVFWHKKNAKFLFRVLLSLTKGEFKAPDFSKDYPAILHINIVKGCRAAGIGSKLINAYLDHLRSEGVEGVHLATMSEAAGGFFEKIGFKPLFEKGRSYLRRILGKDIKVRIYGMRIKAL